MKFKVAAIQMTVVPENKEENIKKALALYDEAKSTLMPRYARPGWLATGVPATLCY